MDEDFEVPSQLSGQSGIQIACLKFPDSATCNLSLTRNNLSSISEIVFKLLIGRKFDILFMSSPFFFKSGFSWADLKQDGKQPCWKDLLANEAIIAPNRSRQDFTRDVGYISNGEDFIGIDAINFDTSAEEMLFTEDHVSPE